MSTNHAGFSNRRTWLVGLGAMAVAIVTNLVVLVIARAFLNLPTGFIALTGFPVILLTLIGIFLATVVFWIISSVSMNPIRTFQIVAVIALILSILPNISVLGSTNDLARIGATPMAIWVLIFFHFITAGISIWFFSTMTKEK